MAAQTKTLLDSLSGEGRKALLERAIEKNYSAGEVLWRTGDKPLGLTLVLEGKVRILRGAGGRQMGIHFGEPGATLGEIPFFTRSTYPATAVAAEPTKCLIITYSAFDHALRVDPQLAFAMLERLSARVEQLVSRVSQLSTDSVQSRLARFILERVEKTGSGERRRIFSLGMTQAELAEELGTVREVVVRSLRSLKSSGVIESAGSARFRVTDFKGLRAAADPPSQ